MIGAEKGEFGVYIYVFGPVPQSLLFVQAQTNPGVLVTVGLHSRLLGCYLFRHERINWNIRVQGLGRHLPPHIKRLFG